MITGWVGLGWGGGGQQGGGWREVSRAKRGARRWQGGGGALVGVFGGAGDAVGCEGVPGMRLGGGREQRNGEGGGDSKREGCACVECGRWCWAVRDYWV